MRQFILIPILVTVFLTSCSKRQYQYLFQQKNTLSDTTIQASVPVAYKIKAQDILQIRNLQNNKDIIDMNPIIGGSAVSSSPATTQSNSEYLVEDDGTIALTGLGRVTVAGLTRVEAGKLIEEKYHKDFLKDPIIELKIVNLSVTVFGEVKSPGNIVLVRDRTTLVQLIGLTGGFTPNANESNVKIIRGEQKNPKVINIDFSNIQSINDPKAILQSGDIIYVEQNKRAIRNDQFLNLTQLLQPALLLFNTALIILTFTRR